MQIKQRKNKQKVNWGFWARVCVYIDRAFVRSPSVFVRMQVVCVRIHALKKP